MKVRHPALRLISVLVVTAGSVFTRHAAASGFQIREQSPSGLGNACAGITAGGEDISSMYFNPASMSCFKGSEIVVGIMHVSPTFELKDISGSRVFTGQFPTWPAINGASSYPNVGKKGVLPVVSAMWSLNPDLKLGLCVSAPFGMETEFGMDFVGRYHALRSYLRVIDIAPNLAYKFNSQWSVGVAFVARKVHTELTNAVDFSSILAVKPPATPPFPRPADMDGVAKTTGDLWCYGYRLGVIFQPVENVRIGLSHHSATDRTMKGDATFQYGAAMPAPYVAGLQAAGFRDGAVEAEIKLPSMTSLGINYDITQSFALKAEISQTKWSTFDELRVKFTTGLPDSVSEEKMKNTMFYSLGFSWKLRDSWILRAGLAQDQNSLEDAYLNPRIPDADRTWFSAGFGYAFNKNWSLDFAYTKILEKDGPMDIKVKPVSTDPNFFRGNLKGTFQNGFDLLALQARYIF